MNKWASSPVVLLLNEIRQRPAIFVGSASLRDVGIYIRGFSYCLGKGGTVDAFLPAFQKWIEKRYKTNVSQYWATIIEFYAGEQGALDAFWRDLDEFLEK